MSALEEDLKRIALAAVSEANRSQRWTDEDVAADLDELAARRRRNETDRYATKAEADASRAEDEHLKDLHREPF